MGLRKALSTISMLVAIAASSSGARADSIQHGQGDWARTALQFQDGDVIGSAYIGVSLWGTTYYSGIPPQEQGGLGDGVLCVGVYQDSPGQSRHGNACTDASSVTLDSLKTVSIDGTVELELSEGDGTPLGSETATLQVTITGTGPIFPGARASTNASPGVEAEYELSRAATVSGSITSTTFGTIDLTPSDAVLERKNCVGYSITGSGVDSVQACRF